MSNKRRAFNQGGRNVSPLGTQVVFVGSRRAIDKKIIFVQKATIDATQETTILITATIPCTITGMRWSIDFFQDGGAGDASVVWAIVINRDGNAANTLAQTDAASVYDPEQNVMAFGTAAVINSLHTVHTEGSTKTMRKLMIGDVITFLVKGVATNTMGVRGAVQFFCKV